MHEIIDAGPLRRSLFAPKTRIVVKVGTRLLTSLDIMAQLMDQLADLRARHCEVILVTSGAVGLGMSTMNLTERPADLPAKQALAAIGQGQLMKHYAELAEKYNINVAQLLLTNDGLMRVHSHQSAKDCLNALLDANVLPIINENDSVSTDELRIGDNDTLAAKVALMLDAPLTVLLTTVDAFCKRENGALTERIPLVTTWDDALLENAGNTDNAQMSIGGMKTKLLAAKTLNEAGLSLMIADGRNPKILSQLANGDDVGTLFYPHHQKRMTPEQIYIRFFSKVRGLLIVDTRQMTQMLSEHCGLPPEGIHGVQGVFAAGETVDLAGPDLKVFARGVAAYSSTECAMLSGRYTPAASVQLVVSTHDVIERRHWVLVPE